MEKKTLAVVLASEIGIITANFALVALFGAQLRSYISYIFGSNDLETLFTLIFLEGGFVFGAGAVYSSGILENIYTVRQAHPVVLDKMLQQRQEMREQQSALGKKLMLVGGPLIIVSIVAGLIT